MDFVNTQNGLPLRDRSRNGKGHLHAVIFCTPERVFVEQSENHRQIIQRALFPDGKLVITCFERFGKEIKRLSETTIALWNEKEDNKK